MYLPLCKLCRSCIYFRDIGVGFCVHPDRFDVDQRYKSRNCILFIADPDPEPDTKMIPFYGRLSDD